MTPYDLPYRVVWTENGRRRSRAFLYPQSARYALSNARAIDPTAKMYQTRPVLGHMTYPKWPVEKGAE